MRQNNANTSSWGLRAIGLIALTLAGCYRESRDQESSDAEVHLELARNLTQSCLQKIGIESVIDECIFRVNDNWILVLGGHFPVQEVRFIIDRQGELEGYYFECTGVFLTMNSLGPSSCEEDFNVVDYCASLNANPPLSENDIPANRCRIVGRSDKQK